MATVAIRITGIDTVLANLEAKVAKLETAIDQAVQGAGIDTQAGAKQACAVDTGRLRSSILYQRTGLGRCTIGTSVFYSWFVEQGHYTVHHKSFVAPRPFLFPAFQKAGQGLINELRSLS